MTNSDDIITKLTEIKEFLLDLNIERYKTIMDNVIMYDHNYDGRAFCSLFFLLTGIFHKCIDKNDSILGNTVRLDSIIKNFIKFINYDTANVDNYRTVYTVQKEKTIVYILFLPLQLADNAIEIKKTIVVLEFDNLNEWSETDILNEFLPYHMGIVNTIINKHNNKNSNLIKFWTSNIKALNNV